MNQVLIVGSSHSGKLTLVKEIFGNKVDIPKDLTSHSGLIFNDIPINTKYFSTKVGIWVDEFNDRQKISDDDLIDDFKQWCEELKTEEAAEIRDVLDGIIFTFNTDDKDSISYIEQAATVLSDLVDNYFSEWDGFKLAVGFQKNKKTLDKSTLLEIDDIWIPNGFEFICFEEKSEKDLKMGKDRIVEILETNDWRNKELVVKPKELKNDLLDDKNLEQMFTRLLDDYDDKELNEKDLNYEDLLLKLQNAKIDISKLDNDDAKKEKALDVVKNVIKYL